MIKQTLYLWTLGLLKIPMIFFLKPTVIKLDDEEAVVKIKLSRRSKNHLGSMYFGALCVGADIAGGIIAWNLIQKAPKKIALVFKSFKAEFLKRPDSDVYFISRDGGKIKKLVDDTVQSGERCTMPVQIEGYTGYPNNMVKVVDFTLELSLKAKSS